MRKYNLGKNLEFQDLYNLNRLQELDKDFLFYLKQQDENLYSYIITSRQKYKRFSDSYGDDAEELIEIAKILEIYISDIFNIKEALSKKSSKFVENLKSFTFKKTFVNKKIKLVDISQYSEEDFRQAQEELFDILNIKEFNESIYIKEVLKWLENEDQYKKELNLAIIFGSFLFFDRNLYNKHNFPNIFFKAKKVDFSNLIDIKRSDKGCFNEIFKDDKSSFIERNNFDLYTETTLEKSLHNSNYCVKCHKRGKDYCRIGEYNQENYDYNKNPLDTKMIGCPLSMHISQMHVLNELASPISALIVATINNPLLAGTGANICNDCSTACIFQKQETVDTPLVETETLKQVLSLPWGFEIYSLLSRWNPLRFYRPTPRELTNKNILVVGLGPAGYSLAYNMSQEGYGVVAVDALKIEPLNIDFKPIIDYKTIEENLDGRIIQGFGGVSEYGITSRWDKNYLKVLRIILERNSNLKIYGGIRFGSNLSFEDAEELGFSHISLCTGAGKPNITNIENSMGKGIKSSSEFLMNLNLGSYKKDNLFNMQIRLPIVVLGGGLTALDCATEAVVYYQRHLEKIVEKYNSIDKEELNLLLSEEDKEILTEYLQHYGLLKNSNSPIEVINSLGGVKVIYHKSFENSRAYKTNAYELEKTLKQGVSMVENAKLVKINKDKYSYLDSLIFDINGELVTFKAKTLIVAIGTNPNNILQEEYTDIFSEENIQLNPMSIYESTFKNKNFSVILNKIATNRGNICISILGDTHKTFNGSVVKAMASSFYGQYAIIDSIKENNIEKNFSETILNFENATKVKLLSIKAITNLIYEINIESHLMAQKFKAGQFFKIQNFESSSESQKGIKLYSEPVILTGMEVNKEKGIIKCIVLKSGVSTAILETISKNKEILFMGPLGEPTEIPHNKKIMVIGGGLANATVMNISQQAKINGCEIIYVGGYKNQEDIFYLDIIKKNSSKILLSIDTINANYKKDDITYIKGNVLSALEELKQTEFINKLDYIYIAGSCSMMSAIKDYINNNYYVQNTIASLNSPMVCGLKGVCGSCLQKNSAGKFSYTCAKQELLIETVDFKYLNDRLSQNLLSEKISYLFYKKVVV